MTGCNVEGISSGGRSVQAGLPTVALRGDRSAAASRRDAMADNLRLASERRLASPAGFEPAIFALKGQRVGPATPWGRANDHTRLTHPLPNCEPCPAAAVGVLSRRYTVRIPSGTPSTRCPRCPANRRATPSPREEPKHLTGRDVLQTHSAHPRAQQRVGPSGPKRRRH